MHVTVLLSFWYIAWHSDRFWPYWITGWQLIGIFGHIQKFLFIEILARPYSLLSIYIAYPMLFVIVYASLTAGGRKQRSEEHTSELQSLMRISYAVFCLKKKNKPRKQHHAT